MPPMVGVPRLVWWAVGPSSRMNWPYPFLTSTRIANRVPSRVPIRPRPPASRMLLIPAFRSPSPSRTPTPRPPPPGQVPGRLHHHDIRRLQIRTHHRNCGGPVGGHLGAAAGLPGTVGDGVGEGTQGDHLEAQPGGQRAARGAPPPPPRPVRACRPGRPGAVRPDAASRPPWSARPASSSGLAL